MAHVQTLAFAQQHAHAVFPASPVILYQRIEADLFQLHLVIAAALMLGILYGDID